MMRRIRAAWLKPSWLPTSTSLRSTLRTPATMFMYTGKNEPMAIRVILEVSSMPSQISSSGTQARYRAQRLKGRIYPGFQTAVHANQGAEQNGQPGAHGEAEQHPLGAGSDVQPQWPGGQLAKGHQQLAGCRHQVSGNPAAADGQLQ